MSDLIEREYLLNIARKEEAYGYVSEHEILNAPTAETTGALDDAIQEYIKDGYILAEPNEYVKDGILTVQMPTMKEAKSIEKVVVYADTYKQEYSLPKVGEWIPIKKMPMDAEERAEYSERLGHDLEDDEAVMYYNLPEDGETVLVSTDYGEVTVDTFVQDYMGCYFEDNIDMEGIVAWMPLLKPYEMERSER